MNFSLSPLDTFTLQPLIQTASSSSEAAPENRLDVAEKDALEGAEHLPTDKREGYRMRVKRDITLLRGQILEMRSKGKSEYAINQALNGLLQNFKSSHDSFVEKNRLWDNAKDEVRSHFQTRSNSLNDLNPDFSPIKRMHFDDEELPEEKEISKADESLHGSIDIAVATILNESEKSSASQEFRQQMWGKVGLIKYRLAIMVLAGCTAEEIRKAGKIGLAEIKSFGEDFSSKTVIRDEKLSLYRSGMDEVDGKINGHHLIRENFEPDDEKVEVGHSCIKGVVTSKASGYIQSRLGGTTATAFKMAVKTSTKDAPEESHNPTRDVAVSSAVDIGLGKCLQIAFKGTSVPVQLIMAVSDLAHDIGPVCEKSMERIQQNKEIAELWDKHVMLSLEGPRFDTSMILAKGLLGVLKAPRFLFMTVQETMSDVMTYCSDELGLTEDSISQVFKCTIEAIANNDPNIELLIYQ